jgi:hypothetical protein
VTHALGRIIELLVKVGGIICKMVFLVVDIDNYDLLLGLDFFIKIGVVIDMEKGVIQVHNVPRMEVEVLPLKMVNMFEKFEDKAKDKR